MTVADADRDLCRLGRRLSPSHDIDCEYRVDLRARAHLRSPFPGIGEPAGGEVAQCFDPITSRGFTRVARGRYPIWGCSGLQQHTRLPTQSRACRERGYTIDSCENYRVAQLARCNGHCAATKSATNTNLHIPGHLSTRPMRW